MIKGAMAGIERRAILTVTHVGVVDGDGGSSSLALQSCRKGRDPNVAVCNVMGLGLEPA